MKRQYPHRFIYSGRAVVTNGGTPVQLQTVSKKCKQIDITSESNNTNPVVVGNENVVAATGSEVGTPLAAGETRSFYIDDASKLWIDAVTDTEGVTFNIYN